MKKNDSLKTIAAAIRNLKRAVVICHYNPDVDAYGSACGLTFALRALGIEAVCVNENGSLPRYGFLPGVKEVTSTLPAEREALLILDCGDLGRVGDTIKPVVSEFKTVINLDHHISNDHFGTLNYVEVSASSTSEIVYDLIRELGTPLTPDIAMCLFAGIVGDTGSFRYPSTGVNTFEAAAALVKAGARPDVVAEALFAQDSPAAIKLQSEAMAGVELLCDGRLAVITVTPEMFKKYNATSADTEVLVERARDIRGVVASALFHRDQDIWRISLRSRGGKVDVQTIASSFGGGGHRAAAGFRWRKELSELKPQVIARLTEALGS